MSKERMVLGLISGLIAIGSLIILVSLSMGSMSDRGDYTLPPDVGDGGQVACTQEAKVCPDGSAVGRTGPNCEFAECPRIAVPPTPPPDLGRPDERDMRPITPEPKPPIMDRDAACESVGGTLDEQFKECLNIDAGQCSSIGGEFDECASACRHSPDMTVCTMQCVQVCSIK